MNIGIFTDAYYPQINGVVTSTRTLVNELLNMGHNVYIFTPADPRVTTKEKNVFRIPSMPFIFLPAFRFSHVFSAKAFNLIRRLKLDVIHTQTEFSLGIFGKTVAKALKIPLVHTYHTLYEDYVHYIARGRIITPKMAKNYSRVFCNTSHAVIAPTQKARNYLIDYGTVKPIHVVPTGLVLEPFKKSNYKSENIVALKEKFNIKADAPVVLFVGRIAKEKSLDVVFRSFPALVEKLPNAKLVAVGNGPYKKDLEALANELGISDSVIFTGEQPWEQIGMFYQLGDVFVSASVSETQGLTYIEAMAAEVPVVAKNDESVTGLITDKENGRLFDTKETLSDVLLETLTDKKSSRKYIKNALETIQPYSSEQFAKSVEDIYNTVIKEMQDRMGNKKNIPVLIKSFIKKQ